MTMSAHHLLTKTIPTFRQIRNHAAGILVLSILASSFALAQHESSMGRAQFSEIEDH